MAAKDDTGRWGEDIAARALADLEWSVLARNWRCPIGEIDIVAADGDEAVIVEVKTRRSVAFGSAAEAVTSRKLARLRRLAAAWLENQDRVFAGVRIDVVAVQVDARSRATLVHLKGVG